MKVLLLLLCLAGLLDRSLCALTLDAPLNLTMPSVNFKHTLRWTAAPGSPPGLTYHVKVSCSGKGGKVVKTEKLWAVIKLKNPHNVYILCVRSSLNGSTSPWSQGIRFTPDLDTKITPPKVTLSGCGKCIQMNITLPKAHRNNRKSETVDMRKIYPGIFYKVSWKQKQEEAVNFIETENQTITIAHLLQGTEYCVQVQPSYLNVNIFQPSPWECVFTSTVQPSRVFAVVSSVAAVVVVSLSALVLILFGLQYTGIICKLKVALPHPLRASLGQRSLLRLERTIPEPLFLLPETGRQKHSHWDQDEEDLETNEVGQMEDQEEDLYMNRCADLSSDSSSKCNHMTSSFQSAATVTDHPESQDEMLEEQKDEQSQILKNEGWMEKESKDSTEIEEWHKELEKYESVNLFSVTITALDLHSDQEPFDVQPLVHTPNQSDISLQQQLQEDDSADHQTQMNYYMRH